MRNSFFSAWLGLIGLLSVSLTGEAHGLPDFTELASANGPAVVNISTTQKVKGDRAQDFLHEFPGMPEGAPWDDLLRRFFEEQGPQGEFDAQSLGSGFIIDTDGYILTNNHVVEGAEEIIVRLSDRRELVAELIGADPRSDIALLKVEADGLPVVKLGDDRELKVGEWVMAIGSPFGFDHSVSVGVVSALGRSLPSENYTPFIQTDVAINPGNSGGPLFNLQGEVVGINSQIYSRTGGYMGVSFAIPVSLAMDVVEQLKGQGFVSRGYLGVHIQDVDRELAESFGLDRPAGAAVVSIVEGSPAEAAGFAVGDVVVAYDGHPIERSADLPPLVGRTAVGSEVAVIVLRNKERTELRVRVGTLEEETTVAEAAKLRMSSERVERLGFVAKALNDEQREALGIAEGGVLVSDVTGEPARSARLLAGDVILRLGNEVVRNPQHLSELVDGLAGGELVPVLIQRDGNSRFVALRIPG